MAPTGGNHEPEATAWRGGWEEAPRGGVGWKPEARPQHRTQVKPCAGSSVWVSVLPNATPDFQSEGGGVVGPGAAGHSATLPWEISMGPRRGESPRQGRDLVAPPGNQAANRENKPYPTAEGVSSLLEHGAGLFDPVDDFFIAELSQASQDGNGDEGAQGVAFSAFIGVVEGGETVDDGLPRNEATQENEIVSGIGQMVFDPLRRKGLLEGVCYHSMDLFEGLRHVEITH